MVNSKNLLLVDDDDVLRETLRDQFQLHQEFQIIITPQEYYLLVQKQINLSRVGVVKTQ